MRYVNVVARRRAQDGPTEATPTNGEKTMPRPRPTIALILINGKPAFENWFASRREAEFFARFAARNPGALMRWNPVPGADKATYSARLFGAAERLFGPAAPYAAFRIRPRSK